MNMFNYSIITHFIFSNKYYYSFIIPIVIHI